MSPEETVVVFVQCFSADVALPACRRLLFPLLHAKEKGDVCTQANVAKTSISNFGRVGTAFSGELPQARTVLLFGSYSGQIFPRRNLLTRRRK